MTETYVSYTPGQSTLVARHGSFVLVAAPPAHPVIGQVWTALDTADQAAALAVTADLLAGLPFCQVTVTTDGVAAAGRDLGSVLDGRPIELGEELRPVAIPDYGGILMCSVHPDSTSTQQLPFEAGVVAADSLMVVQVGDTAPLAGGTTLEGSTPPAAHEVPGEVAEQAEAPAASGGALSEAPDLSAVPAPEPNTAWGHTSRPTYGAPTVLAAYCLQGHLGPAGKTECRTCGEPMPRQTPARIERPALGTLLLSDGRSVELDRDAVLGRAPRVPDHATTTPHLVNLAPFGRDISRQHAEVVRQDWAVAVRDLGSVNGTRVLHPSGETVVAEPGTLVPLQPGSQIEVAEVATLTYQVDDEPGHAADLEP